MTTWAEARAATYVIAEAGSNHDGDLGTALALVDAAAESGADAVKFQLFTAEALYPAACGVVDTPIGTVDLISVLRDLELPPSWLPDLQARAAAAGLDLLCTPFDLRAVATIDALGVPVLKVASPEITDHELLRAVGATGRPVILSTGMSTLADVEEALSVVRAAGATEVTTLQCVTAYPTPLDQLHLGAIPVLATAFGVRTGLSDHSTDPVVAPAIATALGGSVVEKHFTLSRRDGVGPDHPFAVEPNELRQMVEVVRWVADLPAGDRLPTVEGRFGVERVAAAIGPLAKQVSDAEVELAACDRRSIHAVRAIEAGEALGDHNVKVLRGERNLRPGIHPRYLPTITGAHATRSIEAGQGVEWDDLLS